MNQQPLITLIDPDPKGLATLTFAFEREGFTVAGTSDLGMAAALVHGTGARLAVVSIRPPEDRVLGLIAELRQGTEGVELPVLAFGPARSRDAAIAGGAFDYLDTPLFVRDAIAVSRLLLLMRTAPADRGDVPELEGSLDELHGLFFLIRAMAGTGRSGLLQLARGNRKGEVKFFEGAVTSAQVRSLQAFPALHQLLLWRGVTFALKLREVPRRAQFSATGPEILEECERFLRDVTHAAKQVGSLNTVFTHDARQGGARAAEVAQEVAPVARLFDGVRTLGEVIEDSPFRVFDTLRVVKQLVESRALLARVTGTQGVPSVAMMREAAAHVAAPAHAPAPAPMRARVKTSSQGFPQVGSSRDVDVVPDDRRGAAGDRRKVVRRTPSNFEKPAAKPAPAPIPLVTKKSPSGGFAVGEIRSSKVARATPYRGALGPAREPTVHVKQEVAPLSLDPVVAPAPASAPVHAPLSARQPAAPARHTPSRHRVSAKTPVPGAAPFNALEADFFAREADLYKSEGDNFEDLDRGGGKANAAGRPSRAEPPRASSRTKKT